MLVYTVCLCVLSPVPTSVTNIDLTSTQLLSLCGILVVVTGWRLQVGKIEVSGTQALVPFPEVQVLQAGAQLVVSSMLAPRYAGMQ